VRRLDSVAAPISGTTGERSQRAAICRKKRSSSAADRRRPLCLETQAIARFEVDIATLGERARRNRFIYQYLGRQLDFPWP